MTTRTLLAAPIRVRMVDNLGRVLRMARFMSLRYDPSPSASYEVRLADPAGSELLFARELLQAVLRDGRAGDGAVQLHLEFQQKLMWLILARPGGCSFAFKPDSVAAFLARTYEAVPVGEEQLDLDHDLGVLFGHPA
jgi:Streptomyces sporulation and cell division protein, SsgA